MRILSVLSVVSFLFFAGSSFAAGTAANTVINNTAVVDYVFGGVPGTVSDSTSFTVQELLDVNVLWEDAANVQVFSPSSERILRFNVTNTGNGNEQFILAVDSALSGDNFNPVAGSVVIWIDNGDGLFSPADDILYDDVNNDNGPVLNGADPANDDVTVFVLADIPPGLPAGAFSNVLLTAHSVTANNNPGALGVPGFEIPGQGDGGVNANVGPGGAVSNDTGAYQVISTNVGIVKSVEVIDSLGGANPYPGATLRYTLQVNVNGSNAVDNLIITDPIPVSTQYTPGSMLLNGVAQTDAADSPVDFSDFNISNVNAITVDLSRGGAVSVAPPVVFTIIFEVTID